LTRSPTGDPLVFDNSGEHRYEIYSGDDLAGLAAYTATADRIVFTHVETREPFESHGFGSRLVRAALDDARRQNKRVTAQCPFVASYIRRHPEYRDLVDGTHAAKGQE
jgi:uncharacterized protein